MKHENLDLLLNVAYSNHDIKKKLNGKCEIITYDDLKNYSNVDQLLEKNGCVVILYETSKNYGHWICLFKTHDKKGKEIISFFDPYGFTVDDQLDYGNIEYYPYLSKLLYESPYQIEYNEYPMQTFAKNISTCGPWCIARLIFKDLPLKDFHKLFKGNKNFTSDELVALFVLNL